MHFMFAATPLARVAAKVNDLREAVARAPSPTKLIVAFYLPIKHTRGETLNPTWSVLVTRLFAAFSAVLILALGIIPASDVCSQEMKKKQDKIPARIGKGQAEWYRRYIKQPNVPKIDKQLVNTDAEPERKEGFTDLFNGKDLTGWKPYGGTSKFTVEDGVIVGTCVKGSKSTYLCTEDTTFDNFVFTCEFKWDIEGNTGVMFRSRVKPDKKAKQDSDQTKVVYGPQVEAEEPSQGRFWTGGIYGQSCGGYFYPLWLKEHEATRSAVKKDDWNRVTISAQGKVVKTWINGVPMSHWVDAKNEYPSGYFGLQVHRGKKGKIRFRNIKVKRLDEAISKTK
jgi:hypothetical protein